MPQSKTDKSKKTQTPSGTSRKKQKKASSNDDDASDDSEREVTAMLNVEEQDGDSSEQLLQEIEEYISEDKTGPDVNVHLANHVNKRFACKLKDAKLKEKLELYFRPENCDKLKLPLVNHELWGKLRPQVKTQDLQFANVQQTIVKATVALTEAIDQITKVKGNFEGKQKVITSLTDLLVLLGHATYELSLCRRDIMKPSNKELRALCSLQIPVTDFLFGQ